MIQVMFQMQTLVDDRRCCIGTRVDKRGEPVGRLFERISLDNADWVEVAGEIKPGNWKGFIFVGEKKSNDWLCTECK